MASKIAANLSRARRVPSTRPSAYGPSADPGTDTNGEANGHAAADSTTPAKPAGKSTAKSRAAAAAKAEAAIAAAAALAAEQEAAAAAAAEEAREETEDERALRVSRLLVEDFAATLLLSRGRGVSSSEIASAAEGWTLSKNVLKAALEGSTLLHSHEREWDLALRERIKATPRDLRGRSPLDSTLHSLLMEVGKPLPLPVLIREGASLRGTYPEYVRDSIPAALAAARWAVEVREKTYFPADLLLNTGAPTAEFAARANRLPRDPDFPLAQELSAPSKGELAARAAQVLEAAGRPLSHKILGYVLWCADPTLDVRALARATADRTKFHLFTGGYVCTIGMLPGLRALAEDFLRAEAGGGVAVDIAEILRQRLLPAQIVAPSPEHLEEARSFAASTNGNAFSVGTLATDVLEWEAEAPEFAARVQGLNDALRRSPEFLPAGIGRYLLRAAVPADVGVVSDRLRPVSLGASAAGEDAVDIEMSDEGLEGDCAEFVHSPEWEDIGEEVEVRLPRRTGEVEASTRIVVLNHHWETGTLKLRRKDEDFFAPEGSFSKINLRAHGTEGTQALGLWTSRESGLIYGLKEWFEANLPASGGVLELSRDPAAPLSTPIETRIAEADAKFFVSDERLSELRELRASATYLSLFELLRTVAAAHEGGAELPTLWAEVNVVRRTTKRALCSILSAYAGYSFKQRGPHQFLWRLDSAKADQGFKKNKRKFVRR
jgi:hypothetical protein